MRKYQHPQNTPLPETVSEEVTIDREPGVICLQGECIRSVRSGWVTDFDVQRIRLMKLCKDGEIIRVVDSLLPSSRLLSRFQHPSTVLREDEP